MTPVHGQLFKNYIEAAKNSDQNIMTNLMELVEAHYVPRV